MKVIPLYPVFNEANCYIAVSDGSFECAVFDPGNDAGRIYRYTKEKCLEIKTIILTHAHFDHIMAVNELVSLCNAEVIIHKDDFSALYDPSLNLSMLGTGINYTINSDVKVKAVTDGDEIYVGSESFKVISTPGHTPGSACFVCGDIILTGDTLFGGTIGRTDFPGGSIEEIRKSLRIIKNLKGDYTVFPGHSGQTTLGREKKTNYYLHEEFLYL